MQAIFALTLFASATLLFLVQPMFAKMVLPKLGGTPAVWNTCMVFYQAVLLGGYLYAHFSTKWLGTRRQAGLHLVLLLLPWLVLPIAARGGLPPGDANPIPWLLMILGLSVGLPFLTVAASAPMLQAWFADTGHRAGKDPYFLYAASNLGSMIALLGYPFFFEREYTLAEQSMIWTYGYVALMLLTTCCAALLWRSRGKTAESSVPPAEEAQPMTVEEAIRRQEAIQQEEAQAAPSTWLRLRWLALSFAPSSLLLGVTTFISTDIAAVPLMWIIPLALYLLTFVIVFAQWPGALHDWLLRKYPQRKWLASLAHPHWWFVGLQPLLVATLATVLFRTAGSEMIVVIPLHLATFFVTALVCHGELARSRPSAKYLTEFYIWMSLGGVLGGMFNALVAPLVFPTILEYPIAIAIACLLRPTMFAPVQRKLFGWLDNVVLARWLDVVIAFAFWGGLLGLKTADKEGKWASKVDGWFSDWGITSWIVNLGYSDFSVDQEFLVLAAGGLVTLLFLHRPLRYGLSVGLLLMVGVAWYSNTSGVIHSDRSFFGVMRVKEAEYSYQNRQGHLYKDADGNKMMFKKHTLLHGSTNHGEQRFDPEWRSKAVTYYFPSGPIGQVITRLLDPEVHKEIGITGLGTGSTAAFRRPGQRITYFEIDPHVLQIASDPKYFTYLTDSDPNLNAPDAAIKILLGDARVSLEHKIPDKKFDLLLMDAFSSDAIPIHLITKEAIDLYFRKLNDDGILLVHISNRHLDLAPVVGNIARELGLVARVRDDCYVADEEENEGKFASEVVMVVRDAKRFEMLPWEDLEEWKEIPENKEVGVWTDDFSDILDVIVWLKK